MRQRDKFQTSFYFLKKLNMRLKQMVCSLAIENFRLLIQRYPEF